MASAGLAAELPHVHPPAGCSGATAAAQEAAAEELVDQPSLGCGNIAKAALAATAGVTGPASPSQTQLSHVGEAAGLAHPALQDIASPVACTAKAEAKPQQDIQGLVELALGWMPPARPAEALRSCR